MQCSYNMCVYIYCIIEYLFLSLGQPMQLKASKLLITDSPITQQQYPTLIPRQQLIQAQSIQKYDLHQLKIPLISILFAYDAGTQFQGYQLELEVQLMIKGERISQKQLAYQRTGCYLYKLLEIDSCICYQKPISAMVTIKYTENQQCQDIKSMEQLCEQLSKRTFVIYNQKILSNYKRDIIIKQPINTLYRYSHEGYIWMKCTNSRLSGIRINRIDAINWLVSVNEELRVFESKSTFEAGMDVKMGQSIGVMMTLPKYLSKIEVPYQVEFVYEGCPEHVFKMIKYLYIN